jgi:hypothetical protein
MGRSKTGVAFKILTASLLTGLGGCSLIFVDGPPSAHASMQSFSCDESRVWPVIDGGLAALSVVGMLTAETKVDTVPGFLGFGYTTDTNHKSEQVAANAIALALYGTSAVVGLRRVGRCRRAHAELRERLTTQQVSPPTQASLSSPLWTRPGHEPLE